MQQSDDDLVAEIKRGSRSAMEILIRRYYKFVYAIAYRKTGDYHIACDLTQDVFIKTARSISQYQANGKFKGWLGAIAYNRCADFFRSSHNKQQLVPLPPDMEDDSTNLYRLVERNDERTKVKAALMQLPEYQRDVITLSYFEGMKIREIAVLMDCSESTIKSRLRQGLAKLQKLVSGGEGREQQRNHP